MQKQTDQTLAEQLNITPHEIEYRKHLFDFTDEDVKRLLSCRRLIEDKTEDIIEEFYVHQTNNAEISTIIGDADTLRRLRQTLSKYVQELFGGVYDQDYVNRRLHIGKIHRRIGVSPKLYMSSIRLLQELLDEALDEGSGAGRPAGDLKEEKSSLHKILFLDAQFVFDAYIDSFIMDVDNVKTEVEGYAHTLQMTVSPGTRQLREISTHDSLTQLYNHRSFIDFLQRELATAKRHHLPVCLVYFDLNGFKKINDAKGHEEGNRVLADVGKALSESIREIDIPCRYGGDEFCLVLPRTEIESAEMVCNRFIARFQDISSEKVDFSVGIIQAGPVDFVDMDDFLQTADRLMYDAKKKSRTIPGSQIKSETLLRSNPGELAVADSPDPSRISDPSRI
jgi:diguanylate cyclase (GGDEF)-like protein